MRREEREVDEGSGDLVRALILIKMKMKMKVLASQEPKFLKLKTRG